MLILTAEGYRTIRPLTTVISYDPDDGYTEVVAQENKPLPGCSTHSDAGRRYLPVLLRFLNNEDSRFLDRHWQDAKEIASRGMTL